MKTLIVYAHPKHEGHHAYFLDELVLVLENKKIDYELLDLYALNFDPILKPEEVLRQKDEEVNLEIKNLRLKVAEAEKLIFIFPTWWQSMPAILKGFFDRVFSAGFAFKYQNGIPVGLLKGKRAAVFSATGGPKIINKLLLGSKGMKVVVNDTLRFCSIKARGFSVGSATKFNDKQKRKVLAEVNKLVKYLYKK